MLEYTINGTYLSNELVREDNIILLNSVSIRLLNRWNNLGYWFRISTSVEMPTGATVRVRVSHNAILLEEIDYTIESDNYFIDVYKEFNIAGNNDVIVELELVSITPNSIEGVNFVLGPPLVLNRSYTTVNYYLFFKISSNPDRHSWYLYNGPNPSSNYAAPAVPCGNYVSVDPFPNYPPKAPTDNYCAIAYRGFVNVREESLNNIVSVSTGNTIYIGEWTTDNTFVRSIPVVLLLYDQLITLN